MNHDSLWKRLIVKLVRVTVVYSIVSAAIVLLAFRFLVPLCREWLPGPWGSLVAAAVIILCISPFMRAIMIKKNHSVEFVTLWRENRATGRPGGHHHLAHLAGDFVCDVRHRRPVQDVGRPVVGCGPAAGGADDIVEETEETVYPDRTHFLPEPALPRHAGGILGRKGAEYAGRLLSHDLHLTDIEVPGEADWVGHTLGELNFGKKYGVHVVSILRGKKRINIPGADVRLYPQDKMQVIATDKDLEAFTDAMNRASAVVDEDVVAHSETIMRQLRIDARSPFLGKTMKEAGIREKYHCFIAGVERAGDTLRAPNPHEPFAEGDVVWIVGESHDVYRLAGLSEEEEYAD